MQTIFNNQRRNTVLAGTVALLLVGAGCSPTTIDPVTDPNNASLESVTANATPTQISALGVALEASLRLGHANNGANNMVIGSLGREVSVLAKSESRWVGEIYGTKGSYDDNAFYSVGAYNGFARVVRSAKVFLASVNGTNSITDAQKKAAAGFSHTYEALGKLHELDLMGDIGIRVDLDNILKPGPFVKPADALTNIRQLLDQAATELAAGGSSFPFPLSSGYSGFDTPATFLKVNRALAARVALYQGDNAGALAALAQSFYSQTASLTLGPKITFNPSIANDVSNPYYQALPTSSTGSNPATLVVATDNFVSEAEAGDLRLAKAPAHVGPGQTVGTIPADFDAKLFTSPTSSLDIIRNEELILISAEAKAKSNDLAGAVADINVIRTRAGGLAARTAASFTQASDYIDEILKQRRYSLFYEGHRLVDLRRLGRYAPTVSSGQTLMYSSGAAPASVGGTYKLIPNLDKPSAEKQWDAANP
ncbi:RagB/SusD family nutrient uptake outer membrane protein [Hymenobacter cheonanensis]|uniref:RagB/SusD family nutrient uptake outer membrane protein n=1 Tax=Hymenobacter sp. CA2-7 TaxID=3063993 RepID=UPI00271257B9|nr:RagB/SusD family nutrient uptake outer membrane protein [Hymenobacter sp. CA2-7]MDO7885655.1 RagB/SusD family nutrient uptake outer membrane protein [Hymenobacter sp. CA2-7]